MAEVLVLVDHTSGIVSRPTLELLTLARRIGDPAAVFLGELSDEGAARLASFGAEKIYTVDAPEIDSHLIVPKADALTQIARANAPTAVLVVSTAEGKEIAARVAVRLNSGIVTDAVDIAADGKATQSVFAGSFLVESRIVYGTPIITVKPNSTTPEGSQGSGVREPVTIAFSNLSRVAAIRNVQERAKSGRPELAESAVVVSGGRGVGAADGFRVIEALADALGGAVGASRAATDAGWYPHAFQVGQTGKTVTPQLYIACGISGAIQHRAGMQTSRTIIAVNTDPEAPIFELADFGVVGNLFSVLPQLIDEVGKRRG